MNNRVMTGMMMLLVLLTAASTGHAQAPGRVSRPALEAAFTWGATRANIVPGQTFWMQGGTLQLHARIGHGLGVAWGGSMFRTDQMSSSGVGLDLYTLSIGPRYTWSPRNSRLGLQAQCLVGEAWGRNSYFPTLTGVHTSDQGLEVEAGGGANLRLTPHTSIQLLHADWVRTALGNASTGRQYSLRLGSGFAVRF